ncbi:MAG: hypothetical protein J6X71_01560 [Bacteroidales bacterium]|nr:hypothetical protein [Bacteroidales bacterium]
MKALKTISTIALSALVLAGCQQKELDYNSSSPIRIGEKITITATGEATPTKTSLQADKSIFWGTNDQITLLYGNSKGTFTSQNTAPAATAEFEGTLTTVLGATENGSASGKKLYGFFPADDNITIDNDLATIAFKVDQTASAGTFDPAAFSSAAVSDNLVLRFYNVLSALAITVGEDEVTEITVENNDTSGAGIGAEAIVVDLSNPSAPFVSGQSIIRHMVSLTPDGASTFTKGETYYMAVIPGTYTGGVTFTLKHSSGPDTVLPVTSDLTFERSKFHNATLKAKELKLKKVWVHHGVAGVAGWPAYVSGAEDFDTFTRSATMDDDYVYVPKFSTENDGNNFTEATIGMFKVSDGSFAGKVQRTIEPDYMANATWAQTVPIACARVMKNTDSSINGGKDILVASNLCDAQNVRVYAWKNGIDHEPTMIANFSNGRRMGDRIAVSGTFQSGRIWFRQSLSSSMNAWLTVTNGTTPSYGFDALGAATFDDAESFGEYIAFNNGAFALVPTNSSVGLHLVQGTTQVKLYPALKRCFGWTPFEYNGKQYLAFLDMSGGTNLPIITVIEGAYDTVENLQATLDAFQVVARASLTSDDPYDFTTTSAYATNNQGDCTVRIINGVPHVMGMARGGMGVFQFVLE